MIDHLKIDRNVPARPRTQLDALLGVGAWSPPFAAPATPVVTDPDAPAWWYGDEDASQSFMHAVGAT